MAAMLAAKPALQLIAQVSLSLLMYARLYDYRRTACVSCVRPLTQKFTAGVIRRRLHAVVRHIYSSFGENFSQFVPASLTRSDAASLTRSDGESNLARINFSSRKN